MRIVKSFLGYIAAIACIFVALLTFISNDALAALLVNSTGIEVSPEFTGGKVIKEVDHGTYKTLIHEVYYKELISPCDKGVIRIDWKKTTSLPAKISEDIDYTGDGRADFHVELDTNEVKADLKPLRPEIGAILRTNKIKDSYCIRVEIGKPVK